MHVETHDRDLLNRYLLGQLSADEEERVEDRFMADDAYFGVYQEVERTLICDYAAGTMDSRETEHFEANYLVTGERRRQVIIMRALLATRAEEEVAGRTPLRASGNFRAALMAAASAVAALIVAVVLSHNPKLTPNAGPEIASRSAQPPVVSLAKANVPPAASADKGEQGARRVSGNHLPQRSLPSVVRSEKEALSASGGIAEKRELRTGDSALRPSVGLSSLPVEAVTKGSVSATAEQEPANAASANTPHEGLALVASGNLHGLGGLSRRRIGAVAGWWPTRVSRRLDDSPNAVREMLMATYPLTTPTADEKDIITPGAVLVLKKGNLAVTDVSGLIFCKNTYEYGDIAEDRVGWLPQADRAGMPSGNSVPLVRMLAAGEKLWVTGIDVTYVGATFHLLSVRHSGVRYASTLKFPFQMGPISYSSVIAAATREVFTVESLPGESIDQDSIDQVVADLGEPETIVIVGSKQIYFYKNMNMKVTFVDRKVSNVE
jgi:hypothetical protein